MKPNAAYLFIVGLGALLLLQCKPSAPASSQQSEPARTPEFIIVTGGVRSPGPIPYRKGMNIFAVINRAGGATGESRTVKLIRGKTETIYRLDHIGIKNIPELQPGDQIIFPE